MNSHKFYKYCAVPLCRNTTTKTPQKLFIRVPTEKEIRKQWSRLAKRDPPIAKNIYYCEDHFNMPNDMENYMQYKIMGTVKTVRMRKDCLPTRFDCQHKKKTCASKDRVKRYKTKLRKGLVENILNENEAVAEYTAKKKSSKKNVNASDTPQISGPKSSKTEECLENELQNKARKMPLTPAERQKRYREKMKLENPDKYEECRKKNAENSKHYYRAKVSQYTEEEKEKLRQHWRDTKSKTGSAKKRVERPLTPAERQKKYREKLKMENPDKYEEYKKRMAEQSKLYYREKARQYTEEQKEKRRQHCRDSRRKSSSAKKERPLTPAERQKKYREKLKMENPDKYEEYKTRITEDSKLDYREKAKQYTEDEKEKKQQWRDAIKLSTAEKQEICEKREIDNPDNYEQMMECAENSKCCNEKENTLLTTQTTKKEVKKRARKKLTSAERQRRYREKLKKEKPDKYLEMRKNAADYSRQYYRERVSSNVKEQWNNVRRKGLSPGERMKRYRDKLERENPAKYTELLKRSADNAKCYYRKKAKQYTEEEKEARRQKWREARRINKRKYNKRKINKKNTRKNSEEPSSDEDTQPGLSETPMTPPWHVPGSPGVSDTSAQDPLRKHTDQCRFCGEFSSDCFVVSSQMPYLTGHRTTLVLNNTNIQLDFDDGLPNTICRYCDTKLQEIHDFIKTVNDAQDSMHRKVKTEKEDLRETDIVIKSEVEDGTDADSVSISDTVVKTVANKRKSDMTRKAKVAKPDVMVECDNDFVIDVKQETIYDIESSRHSDEDSDTLSIPDELKHGDDYFCESADETIVTEVIKKEKMGSETTINAMSALSPDTGSGNLT